MKLLFTEPAWEDYQYWQANDPSMFDKINMLIRDCRRSPFSGLGKPEPLKGNHKGWWSRRINKEHRLIYRLESDVLWMNQCRFHYDRR